MTSFASFRTSSTLFRIYKNKFILLSENKGIIYTSVTFQVFFDAQLGISTLYFLHDFVIEFVPRF